jgi:hypothetical protein
METGEEMMSLGTREVEFGDANEDLLGVSLFWVLA